MIAPARIAAGAALVLFVAGLAGCAAPASPGVTASTASTGAGTYPNLNVPLTPATSQLTPEERAATADELRARRQGAAFVAAPASSADQLRLIGGTHSSDAIRRIEGD